MKHYTLLFVAILLGLSSQSFAQKLEENKKDDFTNKTVKRTSWETFYTTLVSNAHFCISKVDTNAFFQLKLMFGKVFSIDKDQEILFKLDDDELVKLPNPEFRVTCNGCGATGFQGSQAEGIAVDYPIRKDQLDILKAHKIVKVRINTQEGAIDEDIKEKNAVKLITCLNLVSN